MFERFTTSARQCVIIAQQEARALHHEFIGTEHLLLGLLAGSDTVAGPLLAEHGLTAGEVRRQLDRAGPPLDREGLASIGIDLDAVRSTLEQSFGQGALDRPGRCRSGKARDGHIPFSGRAKKALQLSVDTTRALHHDAISTEHLLLGLLQEGQGLAARIMSNLGVDLEAMQVELLARLRRAA